MPSCPACGRWFSEEDHGCGCPNEQVWMTNAGLLEVKRQAQIEALEALPCLIDSGCEGFKTKCPRCKALDALKGGRG